MISSQKNIHVSKSVHYTDHYKGNLSKFLLTTVPKGGCCSVLEVDVRIQSRITVTNFLYQQATTHWQPSAEASPFCSACRSLRKGINWHVRVSGVWKKTSRLFFFML